MGVYSPGPLGSQILGMMDKMKQNNMITMNFHVNNMTPYNLGLVIIANDGQSAELNVPGSGVYYQQIDFPPAEVIIEGQECVRMADGPAVVNIGKDAVLVSWDPDGVKVEDLRPAP